MATQSKDLLVLLPAVWNLLFFGCHLLNLLLLLVSGWLTSTPHGYSVKGFVAFVACCLGFVVFDSYLLNLLLLLVSGLADQHSPWLVSPWRVLGNQAPD